MTDFEAIFEEAFENLLLDFVEDMMVENAIDISNEEQELKRSDNISVMLEKVKYNEEEPIECEICFENINKGDTTCNLECFHKFHFDCLYEWMHYKKSCPLCRSCV